MNAIETVGLTKAFGEKHAVDALDLTVKRGEIYGFVGRNGAGKSTVMKMLAGLVLPTSGEIALLGEHQKPGCTSRRMGALIEEPGVLRSLTGLENVACRAMSLGVVDAERVAAETLQEVGLADAAHKRVKSYSLGMKQRLGLALALVGSPDLLLLDEPFNGLDPQGVRSVRDLIVSLARDRGVTVFISSLGDTDAITARPMVQRKNAMVSTSKPLTRYGVVREGRLVKELSAEEVEQACADHVLIRCTAPQFALSVLQDALPEGRFVMLGDDAIRAQGIASEEAGRALAGAGIVISELSVSHRDIEELFIGLMGEEGSAESQKANGALLRRKRAAKGGGRRA